MPGRGDDLDLAASHRQHGAGRQAFRAQAMGPVNRSHLGACALGQRTRPLGVVGVPVGEQDRADPLAPLVGHSGDPVQMGVVVWAGVDHDDLGRVRRSDQPCVRPIQRHQRGVGGKHASGALRALSIHWGTVGDAHQYLRAGAPAFRPGTKYVR